MNRKIIPMLIVATSMMIAGCSNKCSSVTPSSDSSSSEPSVEPAEMHTISITGTDGVSIKTDKTSAAQGQTVTISVVSALDGYRLGRVRVVGNTYDHEVFADDNGEYKFTMPDEDVMISYTVDQSYPISYTNLSDGYGYTFAEDSATAAFANDKVTVEITYLYGDIDDTAASKMLLYVNDEIIEYDDCGSSVTFSFIMPEEETSIVFVRDSDYRSESGHKYTIEGTDGIKVYGYNPENTYSYVEATLLKTTGYNIEKVTLVNEDGTETELTENDYSSGYGVYWNGNIGTFGYYGTFESDITIRLYSKTVGIHSITYVGAEHITSELPTRLAVGDTYSLRLSEATFESGWTYDSNYGVAVATVTGLDGDPTGNAYGNLYFTMPDNDVTVEFTCIIASQTFSIAKDEHIKSVSITDFGGNDASSCKANTYVLIRAEADEGYLVASVTLNGTALTYNSYYEAWTGTTSSENGAVQELVITSGIGYNVTTQETEGVTISLSGTTFASGSSVVGTITPNNGFYSVESAKLVKDDGTDSDVAVTLTSTYNSTKRFSFAMPEYNVTLVVTVSKIEGVSLAGVLLGDGITTWSATGKESGTMINSSMSAMEIASAKFIEGETLTLVVYHDEGYVISVQMDDGTPVSPYNDSGTYCTIYNAATVVSGGVLKINSEYKVAVNVTVNKPEGSNVKVSVLVDKKATDTLYKGDTFMVKVTGNAGTGKSYVATVTDSDGNVLEADYYSGEYTCPGDITITVTAESDSLLTITGDDNGIAMLEVSYYDALTDESTYYANGDYLPARKTIDFYYYVSSYPISIVITVGGETVYSESGSYHQDSFTATGDVVITITAA